MRASSNLYMKRPSEQGVAAIEFALTITALLTMFIASMEITRYILLVQKVEKTVSTVTDVVAQTDPNTAPLTLTTLAQLMSAVQDIMKPYPAGSSARVVLTSVTRTGSNPPRVNWQYCGGGTLMAASQVGTAVGGNAVLPNGLTLSSGEEVLIGEMFYSYTPITVQSQLVAATLYRVFIFMPRLGALSNLVSSCP